MAGATPNVQALIDPRMLLRQVLGRGFQSRNFCIDVFDFLLDIVVMFLQQLLGFFHECRAPACGALATAMTVGLSASSGWEAG